MSFSSFGGKALISRAVQVGGRDVSSKAVGGFGTLPDRQSFLQAPLPEDEGARDLRDLNSKNKKREKKRIKKRFKKRFLKRFLIRFLESLEKI